jgi:MATE family multidrug resistance protein
LAVIVESFALIFVLFHKQLSAFFVDMNNVEDLAKNTEVVIAGQLLLVRQFSNFRRIQVVFLGALRGLQDVKIPIHHSLLHIVVGFPINLLRPFILNCRNLIGL